MQAVIDTHAHMADPIFDADRPEVLARAEAAGVRPVIMVSESLRDAARCLDLAAAHKLLKPALGVYPSHIRGDQVDAVVALIRQHRDRLCGIGEVGLDYWIAKEEEERARQREAFGVFVELAREVDLPLNVHSRSAGRHVIAFLKERGASRVQLHAFDARASTALAGAEAGFYFSIPPSILRSQQKRKLVRALPVACLLAETDSPVLGPDADARNEPANILLAVRAIAEIKEMTEAEVRERLYENTLRLYGEGLISG
jgi:TatD DNase family protein